MLFLLKAGLVACGLSLLLKFADQMQPAAPSPVAVVWSVRCTAVGSAHACEALRKDTGKVCGATSTLAILRRLRKGMIGFSRSPVG